MSATIKFVGTRELQQALREVMKVTKKTEVEIVTNALRDVAFRASGFTPKTTAAKIKADLRKPGLLAAIASKWLKRKGKFTKEEHANYMERIVKARSSHSAAVRVGWFPAVIALGGHIRGSKDTSFSHLGSAARGGATKPTTGKLSGEIRNLIVTRDYTGARFGGGEIRQAIQALARAVAFVANRELKYAEGKLKKRLKKYA